MQAKFSCHKNFKNTPFLTVSYLSHCTPMLKHLVKFCCFCYRVASHAKVVEKALSNYHKLVLHLTTISEGTRIKYDQDVKDKAASHVSMLSDKNFKVALVFNLDVLRVFETASLQYQKKFTTLIGIVFESTQKYRVFH